jgi:hypothetical protein
MRSTCSRQSSRRLGSRSEAREETTTSRSSYRREIEATGSAPHRILAHVRMLGRVDHIVVISKHPAPCILKSVEERGRTAGDQELPGKRDVPRGGAPGFPFASPRSTRRKIPAGADPGNFGEEKE